MRRLLWFHHNCTLLKSVRQVNHCWWCGPWWRTWWHGSRGHEPLLYFRRSSMTPCVVYCIACTCVCIVCIVVCIWWTCALNILHCRSCQGVIPQDLVGKYYIVPAQVKHVVELQLCIIDLPTVRKRSNATMHFFDISPWFNILSQFHWVSLMLCTFDCTNKKPSPRLFIGWIRNGIYNNIEKSNTQPRQIYCLFYSFHVWAEKLIRGCIVHMGMHIVHSALCTCGWNARISASVHRLLTMKINTFTTTPIFLHLI